MTKEDKGTLWGRLKGAWKGWQIAKRKGDRGGMKQARGDIKKHAESLGLKPKLPRMPREKKKKKSKK